MFIKYLFYQSKEQSSVQFFRNSRAVLNNRCLQQFFSLHLFVLSRSLSTIFMQHQTTTYHHYNSDSFCVCAFSSEKALFALKLVRKKLLLSSSTFGETAAIRGSCCQLNVMPPPIAMKTIS
ncbi:hypothetical protein GOODEAATRI_002862 [Goodea atripinnis]|uniref:Uncharacterized protein n=1 Tax=Goodea atripinnis TaxID=208336 RepID=A0ABV0PK93_9TELE